MLPATSDMRHAGHSGARPRSVLSATQAPRPSVCSVCAISTPQAPDSHGVSAPSASAPPRKPTEAIAKLAPQASP